MDSKLVTSLKKVLANTFVMYLMAHNFHWNVEGSEFSQHHDFFGNLYTELFGAIDQIAEHVRALDAYAPGTLMRLKELSNINETETILDAKNMYQNLLNANQKVIDSLKETYTLAGDTEVGLSNFVQDRIDIHQKHGWMLRASIK